MATFKGVRRVSITKRGAFAGLLLGVAVAAPVAGSPALHGNSRLRQLAVSAGQYASITVGSEAVPDEHWMAIQSELDSVGWS